MRQLKDRTEGETYGILFRTNLAMQSGAAGLTREGIPFSIKEHGKNIYDHFIVQDILAYLRIAQGTAARADYLRVVNKPFRNISREAFGGEASLQALEHYYADLTNRGWLSAKCLRCRTTIKATDGIREKYRSEAGSMVPAKSMWIRELSATETEDGTDGRMDGDFRFYHGGSRAV